MYAGYLRTYRDALELQVVQQCSVAGISRTGAGENGARFRLATNNGTVDARAVVIATGMFGVPMQPAFAGRDGYSGVAIHASQYRSGEAFRGHRVLVVGIGNTGAEIAADLAEQGAKFVAVSVRAAPTVVPRDVLGVPVQAFGILLSAIPPRLADAITRALARVVLGDLRRYGLPRAQWSPFSSRRIPVIDVGFVQNLKTAKIRVRPAMESFTPFGVRYADGRTEEFDVVVFATGYRPALEHLVDMFEADWGDGHPSFGCGEPTPIPGLYYMGFIESHRGLLFEIDLRSRRLAQTLARELNGGTPPLSRRKA
jgi:cation diffusion facilitator CzcD-associated flavoprotein CzcO